jgi:hypothetical protein
VLSDDFLAVYTKVKLAYVYQMFELLLGLISSGRIADEIIVYKINVS